MNNTSPDFRRIRSFVRREGRVTPAQRSALEELWPCYGIDYSEELLSPPEVFGRIAPVVIDVGSGSGDFTLQHAGLHPENDYIAIEVYRPGIGRLLQNVHKAGLRNVRIINHDAVDVFRDQIAPNTVDEIVIFFPDPWPKKRHHKRRLIQHPFIQSVKAALKSHGILFIATDWHEYAGHILRLCDNDPELINLAGRGNVAPPPKWRASTKYETRGLHLRHEIENLYYAKQ